MRMPWRSPSDLRAPQGDPKTDPPGRGAKKDKSTREWDRQPPPSCDWRPLPKLFLNGSAV